MTTYKYKANKINKFGFQGVVIVEEYNASGELLSGWAESTKIDRLNKGDALQDAMKLGWELSGVPVPTS